jgi:electron transport complex protein RnfG
MPSHRTAPWFQGVLLGGFCLVSASALAIAYRFSAPVIAQRLKEDTEVSLAQVIDGPDGAVAVYRARREGRVSAVAYRVIGKGYGGDIAIIMGVDRNGEILGVRVVQHAETPGLGDKVDIRKSRWIDAFKGLSLANTAAALGAVKKDGGRFDQFSGATITPRAVVKAVKDGLALFAQHRARMLDEEKDARPEPAPKPAHLSGSKAVS